MRPQGFTLACIHDPISSFIYRSIYLHVYGVCVCMNMYVYLYLYVSIYSYKYVPGILYAYVFISSW